MSTELASDGVGNQTHAADLEPKLLATAVYQYLQNMMTANTRLD